MPLSVPLSQPKTASPSCFLKEPPPFRSWVAGSGFPSGRRDICFLPKGTASGERGHQPGMGWLLPWVFQKFCYQQASSFGLCGSMSETVESQLSPCVCVC